MVDIIAYSVFELASAFAPSLKVFLITRALFWKSRWAENGVGAALAFGRCAGGTRIFLRTMCRKDTRWVIYSERLCLWDGVPVCGLARNVL